MAEESERGSENQIEDKCWQHLSLKWMELASFILAGEDGIVKASLVHDASAIMQEGMAEETNKLLCRILRCA